jgi:transposase
LSKQLDKQQKIQQSAFQKLCHQEFNCEADAREAAQQQATKMKYHLLENIEVVKSAHYHKSGRPRALQPPTQLSYHVQANLVFNQAAISTAENQAGRFILATNLTDFEQWSPTDILLEYKQQSGSERGFKFLKDPIFFASSIFVKSSKRVAALAMIMILTQKQP